MNAQLPIARFISDDEFERLIDRGAPEIQGRVELRNGVLRRIDPMNQQHVPHAAMKKKMARALEDAVAAAGLPLDVLTECTVRFGGGFIPLPDVVVWTPSATKKSIPGADVRLLVEIADTTQRDDLGDKKDHYAKANAPELWVIDLKARVLHRFAGPRDGAYPEPKLFPEGEIVESATFPGLAIQLLFPL
jgi:Uma2 family endonuclease